MNAAEAVLRSRGIRREKLGAERGNHDALGYYERLGWQIAAPLPESFACQRQDGTAVTEKLDQWLPAKEIRSCKDQHVVRRTESHLNRIRIEYPLVACRRNRPDFRKDAVSGPSAGQLDLRRMQRSKHTRPWLMPHDLALDKLNFLLADVRGGLGPYVSVFLLTEANWDQGTIGLVLTISGITGIVLHSPIGALIDAIRAKRGLIIAGVVALSVCALAIAHATTLPVVFAADVIMAILGAVLAPTVAAITLGLVDQYRFAARLGRNAAFDRAGNLFIAAVAAAIGSMFGQRAVFYLVPFFAFWTILAVLSIPYHAIDHERARGWHRAHLIGASSADGRRC